MRIALATTAAARDRDPDHAPLAAALEALGLAAETPDWDDPGVDWSRYALVLPRSTWNYPDDLPAFLGWADRVAGVTRLLNPPALLRYTTDKRYLERLAAAGVAVVPSTFTAPGERWLAPAAGEFVVKPAVGADARDARRYRSTEQAAARAHAERLVAAGRTVLTQPYLASVDAAGERALMYFDGIYSHAIRKDALLRAGGAAAGAQRVAPHAATHAELSVAAAAVAAVPGGAPLYARVDLLAGAGGVPCVLELELAEPSLYFDCAPGSAARFAGRIAARLAA